MLIDVIQQGHRTITLLGSNDMCVNYYCWQNIKKGNSSNWKHRSGERWPVVWYYEWDCDLILIPSSFQFKVAEEMFQEYMLLKEII